MAIPAINDTQLYHDLAVAWVSQQNLSVKTPEETVELYFQTLRKMQKYPVERWD